MASSISHVVVAGSLCVAVKPKGSLLRLWLWGATCSVIPDLDAIGYWMGVPYEHFAGHRGITHSLAFAAVVGGLVVATCFRGEEWKAARFRLFVYLFLAGASHGILDAMTNGGLGVALFAPFDSARYFLPFRPIEVSPISISGFLTPRGVEILANEVMWVWLPFAILASGFHLGRRWRSAHKPVERS